MTVSVPWYYAWLGAFPSEMFTFARGKSFNVKLGPGPNLKY
jgi:hypothetical protein